MQDVDYLQKIKEALNIHLVKSDQYYPKYTFDRISCFNTNRPETKTIYLEITHGYFWNILKTKGYESLTRTINTILYREHIPFTVTLHQTGTCMVYFAEYHPFI